MMKPRPRMQVTVTVITLKVLNSSHFTHYIIQLLDQKGGLCSRAFLGHILSTIQAIFRAIIFRKEEMQNVKSFILKTLTTTLFRFNLLQLTSTGTDATPGGTSCLEGSPAMDPGPTC